MRKNRILVLTASLALSLGGAVVTAAAAQADTPVRAAATASHAVQEQGPASLVLQDNELWYKAAPGQTNDLKVSSTISENPDGSPDFLITFKDQVDISLDTDKCLYPSADDHTTAQCTVLIPQNSDDTDDYDVDLGDGDDTATIDHDSNAYATIHGGEGADVLNGSGWTVLKGEAGNDKLDGGGGIWSVGPYGGDGDDTITNCATDCYGGPGNDTMSGGTADQGETENTMYGGPGDDILHGKSGNDVLRGEDGEDQLYGDDGDDTLYGGADTDVLDGGAGNNELHQD